jgi:hypothetical protein
MKLNLPRRTKRRLPTRLCRSWESVPLLSGRKDVAGMRQIAMVLAILLSPTTSSDRARGLNERIPNS